MERFKARDGPVGIWRLLISIKSSTVSIRAIFGDFYIIASLPSGCCSLIITMYSEKEKL